MGPKTLRVYNLLAKGSEFVEVVASDRLLAVAEETLDHGCLLSAITSATLLPGAPPQPIHADDYAIRLPRPTPVPLILTAMIALTPFSEHTGATRVISGSHLKSSSPDWNDVAADAARQKISQAVSLAPGDALIYVGGLWHGAGQNHSDQPRRGLLISFCAGWIRQQENQMLGLERCQVEGFPDRLRRLCGYGVYNGQVGHIDLQRPATALLGSPPGGDPGWDPPIETQLQLWTDEGGQPLSR